MAIVAYVYYRPLVLCAVMLIPACLIFASCNESKPTPTTFSVVSGLQPEKTPAEDGDKVLVHYTGTLDNGEEFDSSAGRDPLGFVLGSGQMIQGFDRAVKGMYVGEVITVVLDPADAYGERQDNLIVELSIDQLPGGTGIGDSVRFVNGGSGVILQIGVDHFIVDANHRLAGKTLTFRIELVSID